MTVKIKADLARLIGSAVVSAQSAGDLPAFERPEIVVEQPRKPEHGDFATPIALQLARPARRAPLDIARILTRHLTLPAYLSEATVSPPGFVNFRLEDSFLQQQVTEILQKGDAYGNLDWGQGKRVQVEFVSANPTGPLTVGRGRGGVIGDTLARALTAAGYEVQREYYYNDAGRQIELLGESLRIRCRQLLDRPAILSEEHYQGEYLRRLAVTLVAEHGESLLHEPLSFFSQRAERAIFASVRDTLRRLNIQFDRFYNEHDLYTSGRIWEALERLKKRGYLYEEGGAQWFRSTELGDEKDRVLIRSNGEPTYRLADIAYHWHKAERGFDRVVDVLGADHHATAPTVLAGLAALGYDPDLVQVVIHQFVTLIRDGQRVRMSTRRGHFVTLDELMDEVGADAVRYFMLSRSNNSTIDFDLNLALEQSSKNPVYYIQNAHVRCAGIVRQWEAAGYAPDADRNADLSLLTHENELAFLRKALELPDVLARVVSDYDAHLLAFYAYDLATVFHQTYETCRVIHSDVPEPLRLARFHFYRAAKQLLARTLDLMGMKAPEVM